MKHSVTIFFCLLFLTPAIAQITFDRTYNTGIRQLGREVFQTPDGGYLLQGTETWDGYDCVYIKTDQFGDTLWTKTYGDVPTSPDTIGHLIHDMVKATDNSFISCGMDLKFYFSYDSYNSYIQKIDSAGNQLWINNFGASSNPYTPCWGKDYADQLNLISNGDLIVHGASKYIYIGPGNCISAGQPSYTSYLSKFDVSNGQMIDIKSVQKIIDPDSMAIWSSRDMQIIGNKICVIGDYAKWYGTNTFGMAIIDHNFDTVMTILTSANEYYQLAKTNDDHFLLSTVGLTTKMDTLGNIVWTTTNSSPIFPFEFIETSTGHLVSIGGDGNHMQLLDAYFSYVSTVNVYLNKYSSNGSLLWSKTITPTSGSNILGCKVIETIDGGFAFVGYRDQDIWFVKTDSSGNVITSVTYPTSNKSTVHVYPNPSNGIFQFNTDKLITNIEVRDQLGKLVFVQKSNSKDVNMDLSKLATGNYYYKVYHKETFSSGKLLIE